MNHPGSIRLISLLCCLCPWVGLQAQQPATIDFNLDIRPILSENCFQCHGPDEQTREADLRLDTWSGLTSSPSGRAVVEPAEPEQSELLSRIHAVDADLLMPPHDSNKSLTAEQRQLLTLWIAQGANWEQHWAFAPLEDTENASIDTFVRAKLDAANLEVAPPAEPYQLVRRLYLDLVGLPPSAEEADQWVERIWRNADQPDPLDEIAYQELVSHLLESPHYGERWARPWLDLARYADTNGYEKDRERSIWPYRDWVIEALNADMPFDQFTIEQLAGDQLPGATQSQLIATGFHRNTMLNEEGGIDPLEFRFHAMTDRVATTGTTWLGLTLGCCQCHTHKYDPISHQEYYEFMAFLNNADEPQLEILDSDFEAQWERNRAEASRLQQGLASHWPLPEETESEGSEDKPTGNANKNPSERHEQPDERQARREKAIATAFDAWLKAEQANLATWRILQPTRASSNLPILTIEEEGKIFASGDTAKRDVYEIEFEAQAQPLRAIQLEALPDERLPARGPGSTYYEGTLGDFFLVELRVFENGKPVKIQSASHTYAKNRYGSNPVSAALSIDGDVQTGWSVHDRQGERHVAVYVLEQPIAPKSNVRIEMVFGRHFASSLGLFRFSATAAENRPLARSYSDEEIELLKQPESQPDKLRMMFLMQARELSKQSDKIRRLLRRPKAITTLVLRERPESFTRPTFIHHRGEYLQPTKEVSPDTPSMLHEFSMDAPRDRLGLAKWIVDERNPLTSRVVVNRAWASFFGTGIVRTVDDFGFQGESPSHPQLLDWLALRFMHEDNWSLKNLHRRIVSSAAYRRSSSLSTQQRTKLQRSDPDNRLLSAFPRTRLEAELLRDSMLVASDKLVPKLGGPPVRPPQPKGVTELAYGKPAWNAATGEDRFRRSLYTYMKRTAPFAMFSTFDAPSGESCVARRTRSNSPLQALTLLNDVMVLELAQHTGKRFAQSDKDADGIRALFRAALTRPPTEQEQEQLEEFLAAQSIAFQQDLDASRKLLGEATAQDIDEKTIPHQAAWVALARVVFSLDEFQTRN